MLSGDFLDAQGDFKPVVCEHNVPSVAATPV
ncbi:Uncharacterised protein [Corynebacterium cystitidis]|nr:Uncharacterised protein [Corynebacterium cystitidis]